ncbi:MAG: hypothetical protein J1E01_08165 [Acetatifactor sp.]|nr:hypothetical protein [Acetatifactor sp.]
MNFDGKDILEDQDIREAVSIYIDGEKVSYEIHREKQSSPGMRKPLEGAP